MISRDRASPSDPEEERGTSTRKPRRENRRGASGGELVFLTDSAGPSPRHGDPETLIHQLVTRRWPVDQRGVIAGGMIPKSGSMHQGAGLRRRAGHTSLTGESRMPLLLEIFNRPRIRHAGQPLIPLRNAGEFRIQNSEFRMIGSCDAPPHVLDSVV